MTLRGPLQVRVFAPAKINLTLHVTGQKPNGYHLLDTLVAFADVGDTLDLSVGNAPFTVSGPEAANVPDAKGNLVTQVAHLFPDLPHVSLSLHKTLPVAAGIGGGSADAAAAFRGMLALRSVMPEQQGEEQPYDELLKLGADIPMCVASSVARVQGIGDVVRALPQFPAVHAVLVNPRVPLSTPDVFNALKCRANEAMPEEIPTLSDAGEVVDWLAGQRNDLEAPALSLQPSISDVLSVLRAQPACLLARMSGSGATCFGVFGGENAARDAARAVMAQRPDWWVQATSLGDQARRAMPQVR
ncbi:4-(cytidine 5'-diphospho)-2-C-methyl-D-erythritol kinase [Roseobacter sp. YSTF-M11]|uniref:4-diphosphocytidyl-2-C-methyl-D-erythritol kinase n=1 Tax=Roseobacter insulae TaxID=2859783 RepID=A0A9X1FZH0_9RHOB|nr:4-(cytidine 5'-diphospho)-2-C-methyl-D-erythritol kinase [Roseobacter insulae]MBW4710574.1 4-(cytidine 5'-diphospho)-2-C-methyl-D-erythritol kinase [Roseobacter insulae]